MSHSWRRQRQRLGMRSIHYEDLFENDVSDTVTRWSHSRVRLPIYNVVDSLAGLEATRRVDESSIDVLSYHLQQSNTENC